MPSSPAIETRGLRVVRGGAEVLHELDLDVPVGEITGLLGPSGCGKSTLMRAIVGVQIVAGRVGDGARASPPGRPALRARVGYVTQAPSVYLRPVRRGEPALLRDDRSARRRHGSPR